MNTLRLEIVDARAPDYEEPRARPKSIRAVRYLIDGRDLQELIRQIELPFATAEGRPRIAGRYLAPTTWALARNPLHFLGGSESDHLWPGEGWLVVFSCGACGHAGCHAILARIEFANDTVTWHGFWQPREPGAFPSRTEPVWDYSSLGPFVFDSTAYRIEVERMTALALADQGK